MRRFWAHRFRRQTQTFWLCVGVLAGLGIGHASRPCAYLWPILIAPLVIIGWPRKSWLSLLTIIAFGLTLGWNRGDIYRHKLDEYQLIAKIPVSITAVANEDAVYSKNSQIVFAASHVTLDNGQKLAGKIQLSGFGVNAIYAGDKVMADGEFYVGRGSVQAYMSYAKISLQNRHLTLIEVIRQKFTAGMQTALPEPLAPFAMGLLVGQRANLPDDVKQDLLMVGLTHIIAVSGYNLTVILHASRRILAGQSKRLSTFLSFGLIAIFLLLAGASASIVRAAIVSILSIISSYYGREFKALNLLAIAAAVTAWANPFYIWGDLSWYLSFLAFYGVMILAPLVQAKLGKYWKDNIVSQVALETVCAETMSLPIILHNFGQMSLIGLPANILITSLVPLAMLLALIAGLAGMFLGSAAGWVSWPASILLNYMLDLAHIMAKLPGIFQQGRDLSLVKMLILYGLIVAICIVLYYKTKVSKYATITDRNVRSQ